MAAEPPSHKKPKVYDAGTFVPKKTFELEEVKGSNGEFIFVLFLFHQEKPPQATNAIRFPKGQPAAKQPATCKTTTWPRGLSGGEQLFIPYYAREANVDSSLINIAEPDEEPNGHWHPVGLDLGRLSAGSPGRWHHLRCSSLSRRYSISYFL
jgi:hypothetical protein